MTALIVFPIIALYVVIGSIMGLILYKWTDEEIFAGFGGMFWPFALVIMIILIIIKSTCKLLNDSKFIDKIIDFLNKLDI